MMRGYADKAETKPIITIENKKPFLKDETASKRITKLSMKFDNDHQFKQWMTVLLRASKPELIAKVRAAEEQRTQSVADSKAASLLKYSETVNPDI